MSDYLWDKTGEPEREVRELEELLGNLAYRPRPLEVPETLMPSARLHRPFSRSWLRIAAALLLTVLAGAALMSIRQRTKTREQQAKAEQPPAVEQPQSDAIVAGPKNDANIGDRESVASGPVTPAKSPRPNSRAPRQVAVSFRRKGHSLKRRTVDEKAAMHQEIASNDVVQPQPALTEEERRAKDQLMLALRLAGSNLRYAQAQVREVGLNAAAR